MESNNKESRKEFMLCYFQYLPHEIKRYIMKFIPGWNPELKLGSTVRLKSPIYKYIRKNDCDIKKYIIIDFIYNDNQYEYCIEKKKEDQEKKKENQEKMIFWRKIDGLIL